MLVRMDTALPDFTKIHTSVIASYDLQASVGWRWSVQKDHASRAQQ